MTGTISERRIEEWVKTPTSVRREELRIWQDAYEYYMSRGWPNLAIEADKQIKRIAHELASDFINSGRRALFNYDCCDEERLS